MALEADAVFAGTPEDIGDFSTISLFLYSDQDSKEDGLEIQFSADGTNWDFTRSFSIHASRPFVSSLSVWARFFRILFTNGPTPQTDFRMQVYLSESQERGASSEIYKPIRVAMDVESIKAIIAAEGPDGAFYNLKEDTLGNLRVLPKLPISSFGEVLFTEMVPRAQLSFQYGIDSKKVALFGSGSSEVSDLSGLLSIATGTTPLSHLRVSSLHAVKYATGQGSLWRGAGLFSEGVPGTTALFGIGDESNGFFFGYNGEEFGVLRRRGGSHEVQQLTITSGSTSSGNVTVTLNGFAKSVPVSDNSGDVGATAKEISENSSFSSVGSGWASYVHGNVVVFISFLPEVKPGSFLFDGAMTGTTASFGEVPEVAGIAPTDYWTPQTSWNRDLADGNWILPVMDWTKGNVFEISFQWLGFGMIKFRVENPTTGEYVDVHSIEYANKEMETSIVNPTLPLSIIVDNGETEEDIFVKTGSMSAFNQGPIVVLGTRHSFANTKSIQSESSIFMLRNPLHYKSRINKIRTPFGIISFGNNGVKASIFSIYRNGSTSGSPIWNTIDSSTPLEYSVDGTTVLGGEREFSFTVEGSSGFIVNLSDYDFFLIPGETLVVTGAVISGGAVDLTASLNWREDT